MADTRSLTEGLASHLLRPVDSETRNRARFHLLDWLGCVAAARQASIAGALADETPVMRAAWLGNVMEMDDVHRTAILHPGPVIWPAVLSGAEDNMDALLDAAVAGYEATIAIGATFDARHYAFHHNTATAGSFGAAAAAARLARANDQQVAAALGLAGSVTGGLWQMRNEPNDAKQWHIAHAVETGSRAAHFAVADIRGPRLILEGPHGVHAATCSTANPMILADGWQIAAVSFKPWGACRHAHPAIDAALALKAKGHLDGPVTVETYADALTFCDRPDPKTVLDAKFSLQHAIAIVQQRGEPELADFEPAAIAALAEARSTVTVREGATFTARYPEHFGARVFTVTGDVSLIDTRGDPERPLSDDGVVAKARALMTWGGVDTSGIDEALHATLAASETRAVTAWLERWI